MCPGPPSSVAASDDRPSTGSSATDSRPPPASGVQLVARQTGALLLKACRVRMRSWQLTLLQVTQSVLLVLLIFLVDRAVTFSSSQSYTGATAQRDPPPQPIPALPDCRSDVFLRADAPCQLLLYTPAGVPFVDSIVAGALAHNSPPLPSDQATAMATLEEVDAYLLAHPQTVLAAVHFRPMDNNQAWSYVLQVNDTPVYWKGRFQDPNLYVKLPLQVALEREFARAQFPGRALRWDVALRWFAHPSLTTTSVVGQVAPVFLLASLLINTVLLMQGVVWEREQGLRGAMTSMGLTDTAYWTAIVVVEVVNSLVHAGLLTALMLAFRFALVTTNSALLVFLLLLTASLALSALGLACSAFLVKSTAAVPLGLVLFIIAWMFMIVMSFGPPYNGSSAKGLVVLFSLFPWSLLSKGLADLAGATTGTNAGISWAQRTNYCWAQLPPASQQAALPYWKTDCILPVGDAIALLALQAAAYMLLALFWDGAVAHEPGGSPRYWPPALRLSAWVPEAWQGDASTKHARTALLNAHEAGGCVAHPSLATTLTSPAQDNEEQDRAEAPQLAAGVGGIGVGGSPATLAGLPGALGGPNEDVVSEAVTVQQACHTWLDTMCHVPPHAPARALPAPPDMPASTATAGRPREGSEQRVDQGVWLFGMSKTYTRGLLAAMLPAPLSAPAANPYPAFPARNSPQPGERAGVEASPAPHAGYDEEGAGGGSAVLAVKPPESPPSPARPPPACSPSRTFSPRTLMACASRVWGAVRAWAVQRAAQDRLHAVHPTWLHLPPHACTCVVGPNGAGKTTTIKCLQGMVSPSGGDGLVWGHRLRSPAGLTAARHITGFCPQFDVLWPQLTALEHLHLFHHIKGVVGPPHGPGTPVSADAPTRRTESWEGEARRLLEQVGLGHVAGGRAGTFSGGMQRRLSLAIALLGDPKLLVLDEPSTGLDPVSRSQVWKLLSGAKAGRCMLLTTHSMEEADVLGDRIGVFVAGRLWCLGSGLRLKSQYGDGIRVVVGLAPDPHVGGSLEVRSAAVRKLVGAHITHSDEGHMGRPADNDHAPATQGNGQAVAPSPVAVDATGDKQGGEGTAVVASVPSHKPAHFEKFLVPEAQQDSLPGVFTALQEAEAQLGVLDVQVGLASLEEVYLQVVGQASAVAR